MIKVTILYPKGDGRKFDFDYYLNVHMPESIRRLGHAMRSVMVERGASVGAPWPEPAFEAICSFVCDSKEAYERAFFPHAEWLQDDMKNYTDIVSVVQLSNVAIDHRGFVPP